MSYLAASRHYYTRYSVLQLLSNELSQPLTVLPRTLQQAAEGSMDALGALYSAHSEIVFKVAFRIIGSEDEANDVLQDVFVGLPRALRRYQESGKFVAWIKRLTVRTALMRVRKGARRGELGLGDRDVAFHEPGAEERLALQKALAAMPASLRIAFSLKEIEGYSHVEIADLIGTTPAASAARVSRAWKFLRKEMAL
jgi:RNA polymerase sigma-70 factor, ECF subfamily